MATTAGGLPYPIGTDKVVDGDDAIKALAERVDVALMWGGSIRFFRSVDQGGIAASVWTRVSWNGNAPAPEVGGLQPWTYAGDTLTLTKSGFYIVHAAISMAATNFAMRIRAGATTLAENVTSTVSAVNTTVGVRYLSAGLGLTVEVMSSVGAATIKANNNDTPSTMFVYCLPIR
jgi:hypothetical protein